jgi:FixJ family two-component response regulator
VSGVSDPRLISIVDDDESVRLAVGDLVRSFGFEVRIYRSAEDFLTSGETRQSSCIISDIRMPGLSGIELKKRLDKAPNAAPVILITARSERWLLAQARASGAVCVLSKPFDAAALLECLGKALVV